MEKGGIKVIRRGMEDVDRIMCSRIIQYVLETYESFKETLVSELLSGSKYGKSDTLKFDAGPEILLSRYLERFDSGAIFLTEEIGGTREIEFSHSIENQPIVFICDPVDRSFYLKKFLEEMVKDKERTTFKEVINQPGIIEKWQDLSEGGVAAISGPTLGITAIKRGRPLFSIILNYLTQEIFLACEAGKYRFNVAQISSDRIETITLPIIIREGQEISFIRKENCLYNDYKSYCTFLGKREYGEHFRSARIFSQDFPVEENIKYREPGGPSRILYLSDVYDQQMGFIVANGEKIIEWIHWLPYLCLKEQGESPLQIFQICLDRAFLKDGILMSPSPTYSIFRKNKGEDTYLIDLNKLRDHENPSRYRSMILVSSSKNSWITSQMLEAEHTELDFSF